MLPYILALALLTLPALAASDRLPLSFESNVGQSDPRVQYLSRGQGYTLFLTPAETVLSLRDHKSKAGAALRMTLIGASRSPAMEALDRLPGKSNYLIGNDVTQWHTDVPQYARVQYRDAYPGIDVLYYGHEGQLEYDFVVAPGADPSVIGIVFDGIQSLRVDRRGDLILKTAIGEIHQRKPVVYQQIDGVRKKIAGRYVRKGKCDVGFVIARYNANRQLVIDPSIVYSSYLGGAGLDQGAAVAVDSSGSAYVTGTTSSANFPTTAGARQIASGGFSDVFVTKLDPTGATRLYSTYIGGHSDDFGPALPWTAPATPTSPVPPGQAISRYKTSFSLSEALPTPSW
jgi:hypothetical protein